MSSWPTTSQARPKTRSCSWRYTSSSKSTAGEMSPSCQLTRSRNPLTATMVVTPFGVKASLEAMPPNVNARWKRKVDWLNEQRRSKTTRRGRAWARGRGDGLMDCPKDLRAFIAQMEAQGLLYRYSGPINKETELYPFFR